MRARPDERGGWRTRTATCCLTRCGCYLRHFWVSIDTFFRTRLSSSLDRPRPGTRNRAPRTRRDHVDGLFTLRRHPAKPFNSQKLYSAVAFGSPLLTSAEYPSNLSQRFEGFKGIEVIARKKTGRTWRDTVGARLGGRAEFERLVRESIEALPEHFRSRLDNVEIVVEETSGDDNLLGHYHGVPLTKRGAGYAGVLPDKISIYRKPIERRASSPEKLAEMVRHTVWHEVAHFFGISDERLREIGRY